MDAEGRGTRHKKPLIRSIALGCVVFTLLLCVLMGAMTYAIHKAELIGSVESRLTEVLTFVDAHIDDENLKECIATGEESEKYRETLALMDSMMDSFDLHYLYAIRPLNDTGRNSMMSVLSAEDWYNRTVDTEGNLYLGWVSDDEYDEESTRKIIDAMERDGITFFVDETGWSTDYTGAMALRGGDDEAYAVLAADIDVTDIEASLRQDTLREMAVVAACGVAFMAAFITWARARVSGPISRLEHSVSEYVGRSLGSRDLDSLHFDAPDIQTGNEVESLSTAISEMTDDLRDRVSEMLSAEIRADAMRELAMLDGLTGIRNKTAYGMEVERLEKALAIDPKMEFGFAMVDLNYLKPINDLHGHDKGDEALVNITRIVCSIFKHSPVFRVGGDEFVVVLTGADYDNIEDLLCEFLLAASSPPDAERPWEHVSAAIGVALYDPEFDRHADDVLKRADSAMYDMKKRTRATRA